MDINLAAFQEPRGVMRLFQFVFSICAFATTTSFDGSVDFYCDNNKVGHVDYGYPFRLAEKFTFNNCSVSGQNKDFLMYGDFSSDAQFFVCTGVLAMLYCIGIVIVYAKFDDLYKGNPMYPLIDFVITVILAVFWLSGSGAWANGLNGLKDVVHRTFTDCTSCKLHPSNFGSLNISLILGFLNFFLWASDLWFIYKETEWFQQKQAAPAAPAM